MATLPGFDVEPIDADVDEYDEESRCPTCHGEGWVIVGLDIDNLDPLWDNDGDDIRCPNCHGSGKAKDATYW
jgi:DnaJ-class molecular chaperone